MFPYWRPPTPPSKTLHAGRVAYGEKGFVVKAFEVNGSIERGSHRNTQLPSARAVIVTPDREDVDDPLPTSDVVINVVRLDCNEKYCAKLVAYIHPTEDGAPPINVLNDEGRPPGPANDVVRVARE
jgi:hypothetical protein